VFLADRERAHGGHVPSEEVLAARPQRVAPRIALGDFLGLQTSSIGFFVVSF
jgi:hypothetical protein